MNEVWRNACLISYAILGKGQLDINTFPNACESHLSLSRLMLDNRFIEEDDGKNVCVDSLLDMSINIIRCRCKRKKRQRLKEDFKSRIVLLHEECGFQICFPKVTNIV